MQATTLEGVDVQMVVQALDAAYTGYSLPLSFTVAATANYLRVHDIVLEASPIWLKDGHPVAIGLLGVRERRAWVGAFGIAPAYRGKGLAQAMFGEVVRLAKRQRVTSIQLEVLDQNERAIQIYRRAGFAMGRKLFSIESLSLAPVEGAQTVAVTAALLRELPDAVIPCWQREQRTLELRASQLSALRLGKSTIVFGTSGREAAVFKAELEQRETDAALGAVAHMAGAQKLTLSNEPEDSPLLRQLIDRAWVPTFIQHEMHLAL
ncbi:MAG: hypothetical protein NVSMB31_10630 [Vulcanimicrobiaceae bacterium]